MVLAAIIAFAVTLVGGLAREAGNLLGLSEEFVDAWTIASGRCCSCS